MNISQHELHGTTAIRYPLNPFSSSSFPHLPSPPLNENPSLPSSVNAYQFTHCRCPLIHPRPETCSGSSIRLTRTRSGSSIRPTRTRSGSSICLTRTRSGSSI
eukprot:758215-Hanusia_phi.AAC.2